MLVFREIWASNFMVLAVFASFLLITNFSSQVYGQDSLVKYENSQYGVKLSYPSDWDIAVNGNEIRFDSAVDNSNGFLNSIVILAYPSFCQSLEKLMQQEIEELKGKLLDFELVESSTSKLNGLNSVNLVYTYSDTNIGFTKVSESIVTNQKYNFYISYSAKPDNYETDIDTYENLLKNIDIGVDLFRNSVNDNQRYTNLDSNMSFLYPANWTISNDPTYFDDGSVNHFAILYSPCEKGDEYSENISFSFSILNQNESLLPNELLENSISYHKDTIKGFKVINSTEKFDLGLVNNSKQNQFSNSYSLTFRGKLETGQNIISRELGIITKDKLYYIQYYSSPGKYDEYHPILEKVISSINFDEGFRDSSSFEIDTIKFQTYYSDFPPFNIKYPTDWVTVDNDLDADVRFYAISDDNPASIHISHEFLTTGLSLEKYTSKSLTELRNALPNFKLISNSKDVLFGNDATRFVYTFTQDKIDLKVLQIFSIFEDTVYIVTYVTDYENYATDLQIGQRMINSFEITGSIISLSGHYSDAISGLEMMLPEDWIGYGNNLAPGFNLSFVYPQEVIDKLKSDYSRENVRSDKIAFMGIGYSDDKQIENDESIGEFLYSDYVCEDFDYKVSTINNMSGMAVSGECNFDQTSMKVIGFNFQTQDGQQIMIFYGADPSTYEKYISEFLGSLKTLKIPNTVPISDPQSPFQNA
ncbi:MAG: DcrB-related protein [Nitrososphaeraceae archaeon]|nr:DcrB-related protein [Nitrososphaeraceae archaeon]